MSSKKLCVCTNCNSVGRAKVPGSIWLELVLWCCLIVPGIIYSFWRLTQKRNVCPECDSRTMIPTSSPAGQELAAKRPEAVDAFYKRRSSKRKYMLASAVALFVLYIIITTLSPSNPGVDSVQPQEPIISAPEAP